MLQFSQIAVRQQLHDFRKMVSLAKSLYIYGGSSDTVVKAAGFRDNLKIIPSCLLTSTVEIF